MNRSPASASELAERAIAAHGGLELWTSAPEVGARISAGGFAFASKFQGSAVRGVEARVSTSDQHVVFSPYPARGRRGVLDADGTVRIETDDGEAVLVRERAQAAFRDPRHLLWWDTLDILYFVRTRCGPTSRRRSCSPATTAGCASSSPGLSATRRGGGPR